MGLGVVPVAKRAEGKQVSDELTEERRKELFAALVRAQDDGLTPKESRASVAKEFGVAVEDVCEVEEEGLDRNWPPFGKG